MINGSEALEHRPTSAQRAEGPDPSGAVRLELARALGGVLLLPVRAGGYLLARSALRAELQRLLEHPATIREPDAPAALPDRPLRIFISCAEASGEIHARSAVRALRRRIGLVSRHAPQFTGLGGERLASEGVELIGRPVERASMGFQGVGSSLSYYTELLRAAGAHFRDEGCDVCVPVDSPALHVPLAHIAQRYGVPVVHFVAPQYWGWAPWRVAGYRRAVDLALTILPFEPMWFAERGVRVEHVGHPLLDALEAVPMTRPAQDARELVLLPGSRKRVIEQNLDWMLRAASRVRHQGAPVPIVVAHEERELDAWLSQLVERANVGPHVRVETGDLHATLARARAALSVSGTVLIDLLHHRLPAVVVYRLANRREAWMSRHLLTVPWFSSVNLLAARELYPEFCFSGEGPLAADAKAEPGAANGFGAALQRCYDDRAWRAQCIAGLELASARLGGPGAADRAAGHVLATIRAPATRTEPDHG